jgi:hypothetical protein
VTGVGDPDHMINGQMRRRYLALVVAHPGRTATELEAVAGGTYARSWVAPAIRVLLDRCEVRRDADGRYWPV